jgi:hypothetical protein
VDTAASWRNVSSLLPKRTGMGLPFFAGEATATGVFMRAEYNVIRDTQPDFEGARASEKF